MLASFKEVCYPLEGVKGNHMEKKEKKNVEPTIFEFYKQDHYFWGILLVLAVLLLGLSLALTS